MNTEALTRILFVCIITLGFIAGCQKEEETPSPVPSQPTESWEPPKSQEESPTQEYEKLYSKILKQKQDKEGVVVNIGAATKKKVAAFRQASPEERVKLLEGLRKQAQEYKVEQ